MRAFRHSVAPRAVSLITLEAVLIFAAVALAAYVRLDAAAWAEDLGSPLLVRALLVAVVCQLCLHYADLYNMRVVSDRRELIVRLLGALGWASFILATIYFWAPAMIIGRGVFAIAAAFTIALVVGWRLAFEALTRNLKPRERLLIVGTTPVAVTLARELHERKELGVEIVGFIDPDPARIGAPVLNPGVIGAIEDIPSIVDARHVDRVVVSLADARGRLPMDRLLDLKLSGTSFDHVATVYEEYTGKIAVDMLRPSWFIFSEGFRTSPTRKALKRTGDIVLASIGLLVTAPVMMVAALVIKLTSPGPILYTQTRVGLHGRHFRIYKFRSMRADAEAQTGAVWARENDDRITFVGRILRRSRIDELPQLWNVLRGEMSFVGPRPERPEFLERLAIDIPFYGQRHVVKPGVTGWAQIRYGYGSSIEDALEKLQYDLFYIKHLSLALDCYILFETLKVVLLRRGT